MLLSTSLHLFGRYVSLTLASDRMEPEPEEPEDDDEPAEPLPNDEHEVLTQADDAPEEDYPAGMMLGFQARTLS